MSNSNGTQTLVKSMNGILSFDTGGGVVISGDTIVADTLDLTNLNINNIQGKAPADNITLYTNTTGNITLGQATTAINAVNGTNITSTATNDITSTATRDNTVKATRYAKLIGENQVMINTNSTSVGTITIDAGSATNINNATGKPTNIGLLRINAGDIFTNGSINLGIKPSNIAGKVIIGGGQQIEGLNNANGMYIGNDLTAGTFYLGNSTVGPSTTHTATSSFELTNYQTVQAMIPAAISVFPTGITTDTINCYTTGTTAAYTLWDDGFNTTNSFIRLGSTQPTNNTAFQIAENNGDVYIGNNFPRSANVVICNSSSYSGTINIANNDTSSLTNTINMGNNKTNLNICNSSTYGGTINLNTTSGVPNIVKIGGTLTTNTINSITTNITGTSNININATGGNTNINSTSGTGNVNIGTGTNTGTINIGNVNSTNININDNVTINGGIKMANTNISGTAWKVAFGRVTSTPAVNANSVVGSQFLSISGTNFSSVPIILLSVNKTTFTQSGAFLYVALDATPLASSPASFYWAIRNGSGSNAGANSYIVSWFAIGPI